MHARSIGNGACYESELELESSEANGPRSRSNSPSCIYAHVTLGAAGRRESDSLCFAAACLWGLLCFLEGLGSPTKPPRPDPTPAQLSLSLSTPSMHAAPPVLPPLVWENKATHATCMLPSSSCMHQRTHIVTHGLKR
jgi:hypothetical protein